MDCLLFLLTFTPVNIFSQPLIDYKDTIFGGIQQVGIGIPDVHEAWKWYRENLGFDIPVFEEAATAGLMLPYTGGQPQDRHAILAMNMQGGGGLEIWQYTSRTPQAAAFDIQLGDIGIYACKIKSSNVNRAFKKFDKKYVLSEKVMLTPDQKKCFYVKDPYGNIFQIVEEEDKFMNTRAKTGGVYGAIIGVRNMQKSLDFYSILMDYHITLHEGRGHYEDFECLPGGDRRFKRAIIKHFKPRIAPFSELLGPTQIELVQLDELPKPNVIFKDRYWGDLGFIHLCFDIQHMDTFKSECDRAGYPFTVDSADSFDMGEAAGRFSYIEDPDGTLLEFVETHKVPILKKYNWYLDLTKRPPARRLPRWMLMSMSLNRKK